MKSFAVFALFFIVSGVAHAAKLPPAREMKVLERYTVPAIEISGMTWRMNPVTKARELVLDEENHPIISIDNKKTKKPNLFLLSPL